MKVSRARHRAIIKSLTQQYGLYEAYDMYGTWTLRNPMKCIVCHSKVHSYSEWRETGYEHERCSNGCWNHTVYGLISQLETKGFYFEGKLTEEVYKNFQRQIERNAEESKRRRLLFYRKKKSQRKRL